VSLTGEVRNVSNIKNRIGEAIKLNIKNFYLPGSMREDGVEYFKIDNDFRFDKLYIGGKDMELLKGKNAVIFGVANDKSIAYAVAKLFKENGANLGFTYAGEALKKG